MRYVFYGAGAIGGVMGAMLQQSGQKVAFIARGAHLEAMRTRGLTFSSPAGRALLPVDAYASPAEAAVSPSDIVVLAMKSQDTAAALETLASLPGSGRVPILCAQNGVENERLVARQFERVYGMMVILPAAHLEPGVVEVSIGPLAGSLAVGRYPRGRDELTAILARDFAASGFAVRESDEVMRWKYSKLLSNLGNILDAAFGEQDTGRLREMLIREGRACYDAARIVPASDTDMRELRSAFFAQTASLGRPGSSTWQSVARGLPTLETAYLNGEIVLLGRLHGVATPANARMLEISRELAAGVRGFDVAEVLSDLGPGA